MASGDELVYRLILDSQDNTSAPTGGTGSSNGGTRPKHPADEAQANQLALQMAKSRIDRESMLTLADQQYRSIKTGKRLSTIQDEDHQAKLDRSEAEAQRQRDAMAKVAAREEKAAQAALARQQRQEERERQQFERKVQAEAREAERQRVAKIRAEDQQHRDESAYDRDMLQQKKLKEQEARRLQDAKNANDPNYLAAEALKREKLYEATRLRVEGAKRGMTPDEVERQERAEESARNAAGYAGRAGAFVTQAARGPLGLAGALGNLNPITAPIVNAITGLTSQALAFNEEMRKKLLEAGRFSPEVSLAKMQNELKAFQQDFEISKNKGKEIAKQEKEAGFFERANKQAEAEATTKPEGAWQTYIRELRLLRLGWESIWGGQVNPEDVPFGKLIAGAMQPPDLLTEKGKRALQPRPFQPPDPFEFRVHRVGMVPGVGAVVKVPFVRPQGVGNPQMRGE